MFVVDAADLARVEEFAAELDRLVSDLGALSRPVLFALNKDVFGGQARIRRAITVCLSSM